MIKALREQHRQPGQRRWDTELCLVSSETRKTLSGACQQLEAYLNTHPEVSLAEIACSLAGEWSVERSCVALVVKNLAELKKKLAFCTKKLADPTCQRIQDRSGIYFYTQRQAQSGKVAFLFPGEGAQYQNMLSDLCMNFPEARQAFDDVDRACALAGSDFVPSELIFPHHDDEGSEELFDMKAAIEAVVSANTALMRVFQGLEIQPDATVGHSSGEFIALEMAGAIRFRDNEERIQRISDGYHLIGELMAFENIPQGILLAVGATDPETIDGLLKKHEGQLVLAMSNCPHQVVLCAKPERVDEVTEFLVNKGALVNALPFDRPYHTAWYKAALEGLRTFFKGYTCEPPSIDLYSCASADLFPPDRQGIEDLFVDQWASEVRFQETILKMYERGVRIFVEVGPRGNLISFVNDILRGQPHVAIPANRTHRTGITQLHHALGMLAAHGVSMKPSFLYTYRNLQPLDRSLSHAPAVVKPGATWSFTPGSPVLQGTKVKPRKRNPSSVAAGTAPSATSTQPPPLTANNPPLPPKGLSRESMLAYLENMQQFLHLQQQFSQQMLGTATGPTPSAPPPTLEPGWPMLHRVLEQAEGEYLVAEATYTIERDTFLIDHTLGTPHVSIADPTLAGLPVMPLTMTLEIMAEAAAALVPGKVVVGLRDVQASRWIGFESGPFTIRITARHTAKPTSSEVHVEVREYNTEDERDAVRPCMAEAVVLLADHYPNPEPAPKLVLKEEKPCQWEGQDIYYDRLFHGPSFQAISSITGWAPNGMRGTLNVPSRTKLFRDNPSPTFIIDPVLLDAIGASLGLWDAYEKVKGSVMFPVRIKELRVFAPPLPEGSSLQLDLHVNHATQELASADIYATHPDGTTYVAIKEWQDRPFSLTPELHQVILDSRDHYLSEPFPLQPDPGLRKNLVCQISPETPATVLESSHRVWQKMLAFNILNREEREEWKHLDGSAKRRIHWLWGRAVAKDAVRRYLKEHYDLRMAAPDIQIQISESGKAFATGPWQKVVPQPVDLSIGYSSDIDVALVGPGQPGGLGVGVSVTHRKEVTTTFLESTFSSEDRERMASLTDPHEYALRCWCAKEAVSKALAAGMRFDPRDIKLASIDEKSGRVAFRLAGNWLQEFATYQDHLLLTCTYGSPKSILAVCSTTQKNS